MTTGDSTADYPSSQLAGRGQDRKDFWKKRFTPKKVNAPKAVVSVPEEGQPRESTAIRLWMVALGEHASGHVFIDVDSECFVDLLRDSWAHEAWVTSFQFKNDPYPAAQAKNSLSNCPPVNRSRSPF